LFTRITVVACLLVGALCGCATQVRSYTPVANQTVFFNQGVGAITWQTDDAVLTMYPTFRYQSPSDIPTFTLMVQNKSGHDIDFTPENINASIDNQQCHVYTLQERVAEIRRHARNKQIALAIAGGLAAAGAGYAASHQTATYNSYGVVGHHAFYQTATLNVYDPAAGIFAGAVVGAATGIGIHQIAQAAGYEEQAAQGIFQHSTIAPGTTVVGQVIVKLPTNQFGTINFGVPIEQAQAPFAFAQATTD
jgi:hypothetical protein